MARKGGVPIGPLSGADLQSVADALTEVLPSAYLGIPVVPRTIGQVMGALGLTRREQIARGAIALSGTSDKRSRAYKTARRRLERYTTTGAERRRPQPTTLEQLAKVIRRPHLPTDASLAMSLCADVFYLGQRRCPMPIGEAQRIDAKTLGTVRRHLRDGEALEAARALLGEWVYAYGLNTARDASGVIANIDEVEIEVVK